MIYMALVLLLHPTVYAAFTPEVDKVNRLSYTLLLSAVFFTDIEAMALRNRLFWIIQNGPENCMARFFRRTVHMLDREAQEQDARIRLEIW
jgi:hypothetical protein